MLLPALADLRAGNRDWLVFVQSAVTVFAAASLILVATRGVQGQFTARFGFLLTTGLWVTAGFLGALPLYFSHLPISFAEAIFESVSGVTTTGGTALVGLDKMPRGILLWRALLSWIGGVGFIGLALLLLPSLRVGGVKLFSAESAGASEKVLPRIHQIANAILLSYLVMTILCVLCYFVAGMSLFDAISNAMTTVSTSGFSTHDASFGYYAQKPAILWGACLFMVLASLPFVFYIKAALPGRQRLFLDPQLKVFLSIVLGAGFVLGLFLHFSKNVPLSKAFLYAFFNFISIITTTGYTTEDYTAWGGLSLCLFFLALLIGGCSGSTSGGIKVNRLIVLWRLTLAKLTGLFSPHRVLKVRYGAMEINSDIAQNVLLFVCLYLATIIGGCALLLIMGLDFVTAFTGAMAALSNAGPGFGAIIGPAGTYASVHDNALWVFSFLMLAGRLEIITVFILFVPAFWQR